MQLRPLLLSGCDNLADLQPLTRLPRLSTLSIDGTMVVDLAALQDMLTGMVLTDLDGINPALAPSTRVTLQRAGFSQRILQKTARIFF